MEEFGEAVMYLIVITPILIWVLTAIFEVIKRRKYWEEER